MDLGPELDEFILNSDGITAVPDEIGLLTGLTYLEFTGNQITSIPTTIGNLVNLEQLRLDGNSIQAVPAEIGQLTLQLIYLASNDLQGVPDTFRNFNPTWDECTLDGNTGFSCANITLGTSCCTAENCGGDTSTCYTP